MKNDFDRYNALLSIYATKHDDVIRLKPENVDYRLPFFRDIDRIIHSLSYTRYIDKTQVFSCINNDHVSKRMIHVQLVSKIARTIGRALELNEDLIEASALGHDLGHVPFGHVGEKILSELSVNHGEGFFNHNIQSVRDLLYVENNGNGLNISLQVLDAIMCHNGELLNDKYFPIKKDVDVFFKEYNDSYLSSENNKKLIPMTLEGCVVRISDIIGYVGRDLEDAIRMNVIKLSDVPSSITDVLGDTNKEIVNTIVNDIIKNSIGKPYIKMSNSVYKALLDLKDFNTQNIYFKVNSPADINQYKLMFETLFNYYLNALENKDLSASIYEIFLNDMSSDYINNNSNCRKVIDYISGMTDEYFMNEYSKITMKL